LLFRRFEAEADEIEARGLARALVDLHRRRHGQGDLPAHASLERALAREAKCDFRGAHPSPPAVHSIKPDPHVSPAPIPVINTRRPAWSLPSALASASASGIAPDGGLPELSTSIPGFSPGIPSFCRACSMMRTFAWCGT